MYIAIGLGNPGEEYSRTRHNTGKMVLEYIENHIDSALVKNVKFLHQDTYMNKSGSAVAKVVRNKKSAEKLIVIYDDLDLPLGSLKISYNRGSGGHRGLESVARAIKTKEFIRMRIGSSPTTPTGKLKKPKTEKDVEKFILGEFKKPEVEIFKKVSKRALSAFEIIIEFGYVRAMTEHN